MPRTSTLTAGVRSSWAGVRPSPCSREASAIIHGTGDVPGKGHGVTFGMCPTGPHRDSKPCSKPRLRWGHVPSCKSGNCPWRLGMSPECVDSPHLVHYLSRGRRWDDSPILVNLTTCRVPSPPPFASSSRTCSPRAGYATLPSVRSLPVWIGEVDGTGAKDSSLHARRRP